MKSIGQKLERISALLGTGDLSDWEADFVKNVYEKYRRAGNKTTQFSDKQVEVIDSIFDDHYGD